MAAKAVALFIGALVIGCSPGSPSDSERAVFLVKTGFSQRMTHTATIDIVNLGVPDLHNTTGQSVRLRGVTLVSEPKAVHLRRVLAYSYRQTGGLGFGAGRGNLLTKCRQYTPHPVTAVVTAPHSDSDWFLVVVVTFARPGVYYLGRVRLDYTTNGQKGWQYQNLYTTIVITAPRKGERPAFDGCP